MVCSTGEPDRFRRLGVFRATGEQACTALKYNLRPSVQYDSEDPWESQTEDRPAFQATSNYRERRTSAMNIAHVSSRHGRRKRRHLEARANQAATSIWENTFDPHRRHGGLSKLINTDAQESWDPDSSWAKGLGSAYHKTNSAGASSNTVNQLPSYQSMGSRKSTAKAVHVEYQNKMTDPLSIYLLDPAYSEEHVQRLQPRMIMLV